MIAVKLRMDGKFEEVAKRKEKEGGGKGEINRRRIYRQRYYHENPKH
jgi:hypothetical protein